MDIIPLLHSFYTEFCLAVKTTFFVPNLSDEQLVKLLLASTGCNLFLLLIAKWVIRTGWFVQIIYTVLLCAMASSILVFLSSAANPFMLANVEKVGIGFAICAGFALYFYIIMYYVNMCALSGIAYKTLHFGLYDSWGYAKWIGFTCAFSPVSGLIIGGLSLYSYEYMLYGCLAYIVIHALVSLYSLRYCKSKLLGILFIPIHSFIQLTCVLLCASFIHVYLVGIIGCIIFAFFGLGSGSSAMGSSSSGGRTRVGVTEDNEGNPVDIYEEDGRYHAQYRGGGSRMGY